MYYQLFASWWQLNQLDLCVLQKLQVNGYIFNLPLYDDVIKWKHFPRYWPFVRGNSPIPGEFPAHRPVTRSFDFLFDLRLHKWLSKQSWGWWFETLSWSLWCHCNADKVIKKIQKYVALNFRQEDTWQKICFSDNSGQFWPILAKLAIQLWTLANRETILKVPRNSSRSHDGVTKWKHFPR